MKRYKIEKNTVQETLVIPLYGRWLCSQRYPHLFQDENVAELMERIDYDFFELEKRSAGLMQEFGAMETAMRQKDMAWEVRDYLLSHPNAAVVNLGCGLDCTGRNCDNGSCKIYNIDLPDVIRVRNRLLLAEDREKNLALDLNDPVWMAAIDSDPEDGTVLFAAGVFYYFQAEAVRTMVAAMSRRFPGGRLVFDAAGKTAVKLMLKTWVKQADIQDVGAYFSVAHANEELGRWAENVKVTSRGYMEGYQELTGPGVKPIHRLMAKIADGPLHLQIVRMEFDTESNTPQQAK